MAYFYLYVDSAAGSNSYGGSNPGSPVYTLDLSDGDDDCDVNSDGTQITDNSGNDWYGVQQGDIISVHDGGYDYMATVSDGMGTPTLTVSPALDSMTWSHSDLACDVGGSWADPDFAWGQMELLNTAGVFSDGTPPWIVLTDGETHELSYTIYATQHGTAKRTLNMGGATDASRVVIECTGDVFCGDSYDMFSFENIHFESDSGSAFRGHGTQKCYFRNCKFENTNSSQALVDETPYCTFDKCVFTLSGTACGDFLDTTDGSVFIDCEFENTADDSGTDFTAANSTFIRCTYNGCQMELDGTKNNVFVNCNFVPGASKSGLKILVSASPIVTIIDCIFHEATSDGHYGVNADAPGYSLIYGHNNMWYANGTWGTSHRNNCDNYPGTDDIEGSNPNLDTNDIPTAGSLANGAGSTTNGNIGRRESAAGAVVINRPRRML